jgi:hypothetical protein
VALSGRNDNANIHESSKIFMNAQAMTRHDLEARIVKRWWEDTAFCKKFASDLFSTFQNHRLSGGAGDLAHRIAVKTSQCERTFGSGTRKGCRGRDAGCRHCFGNTVNSSRERRGCNSDDRRSTADGESFIHSM